MKPQLDLPFEIALQAAVEASAAIVEIYNQPFDIHTKSDGSPVTQADLASSQILVSHLEQTLIPIVCEETQILGYSERKKWTKSWCVDPLDGTKEFIKKNGEFCICIALIEEQKPTFGLICSPLEKQILFGGSDSGVYLWDFGRDPAMLAPKKIEPKTRVIDKLYWIGSRSHLADYKLVFNQLTQTFQDVVRLSKGSALKFFDLALQKAEFYPRFAPTMEWDIAAGQAIMEALGGQVIDYSTKQPLRYNKESLYNPHFLAKTRNFIQQESAKQHD